ncbi:hypothetical protein VP03_31770 [Sinorhizobium meliloti]|uniref:ABC transporter permease subunit n=1 Tax=Rhizobium meliloti TaxID=382 RepID=UPI0006149018|nr:ABC transporter permease subunit [Sinorhizobium meliloti]KKA07177.1 hypothetical protein VP03_31770 [Sinorhizobium meliloti]
MSFLLLPLTWLERNPIRVLLIPVTFLVLFYVVPLLGVVVVSLFPGGNFSLAAYGRLLDSSTFFYTIVRTVRLSLVVSIICLVFGFPFAYLLTKVGDLTRRLLIFAVMVPFFTSVLIRSYAWVSILGLSGPLNKLLVKSGIVDTPLSLVYNEVGALIGMTQIQLPLMVLTLYGALRRIDTDLMRAAEILGAHRLVAFIKIYLPLSWPGVVSGLGLVFTSTLGFYVTPALLGGPSDAMVTQSIYVQLNTLGDFSGTAAQATVLLLIVLLLLFLMRRGLGATPYSDSTSLKGETSSGTKLWMSSAPEYLVRRLGKGSDWLLGVLRVLNYAMVILSIAFLSVTLFAVIPIGLSSDDFLRLPPTGYSLRWVEAYLDNTEWLTSTYFSIWISLGGAVLATMLASIAAYAMARWESRSNAAIEIFFVSPMIVPHFVIALALYFMFIKLDWLGSPVTYVLTYGVFCFPSVFLVMYAAFQRFDFSLVQAGANLGAGPFSIWQRIVIPILLPSFLSGGMFAFLIGFDDLVGGLFFSTGGKYTLPMRMWADIRNEISPMIAAVAVVFFAIASSVVLALSLVRLVLRLLRGPRTLVNTSPILSGSQGNVHASRGCQNAI